MVRLIHIISHNFKNVLLQRSDGQNLERMVQHPFEADGGVLGVTFQGNGTVTTRFRYVRTIAFTNERRKGQRLYKAMDSTRELGYGIAEGIGNEIHTPLYRHHLLPGLNKKRKNTSNTRVVYWGKRLLSMWEGGAPYRR
jgi:all-trans-8'-apo-beta-carotenal 15,15'-oxygenase